jgi:hypothetical protein
MGNSDNLASDDNSFFVSKRLRVIALVVAVAGVIYLG